MASIHEGGCQEEGEDEKEGEGHGVDASAPHRARRGAETERQRDRERDTSEASRPEGTDASRKPKMYNIIYSRTLHIPLVRSHFRNAISRDFPDRRFFKTVLILVAEFKEEKLTPLAVVGNPEQSSKRAARENTRVTK